MTDSWLMEADCVHGVVWFECKTCDALSTMDAAMRLSTENHFLRTRDALDAAIERLPE